jgi:DNA-directed RNA polymerase subunit RPC12/RpoP
MSEKEAIQGLTCPKCGGVIAIPEGQEIVNCPYCEQRSVVKGERGLRHYQAPLLVDRSQATAVYQKFLHGNFAIARDCSRQAQLREAFVAYVPFWAAWGRALAWAFGEKEEGDSDHRHYEPCEVRFSEEVDWNGAACDVGEFGVTSVPLNGQQLQPYKEESLHSSGMVFEPVGSASDARAQAEAAFKQRIQNKTHLDRLSQLFVRMVHVRMGLVYYPLWIIRYIYKGRAFQVAVDGSTGKILYGKAPGNTLYRAGILVGGMAAGAFVGIDLPALILSGNSHNSGGGVLFMLAAGAALMFGAYRAFRYGEEYEFHSGPHEFNLDITKQFGKSFGGLNAMIDEINHTTTLR